MLTLHKSIFTVLSTLNLLTNMIECMANFKGKINIFISQLSLLSLIQLTIILWHMTAKKHFAPQHNRCENDRLTIKTYAVAYTSMNKTIYNLDVLDYPS